MQRGTLSDAATQHSCHPYAFECYPSQPYFSLQVVYGHLDDPEGQDIERGVSYLKLRPGMVPLWLLGPCMG